nr:hypothetical protein [Tanacetum cinerariifolium]
MMKKAKDIKNMTIVEYMEYEAELKKQCRRSTKVSHLNNYKGIDVESSNHKKNIVLEYPHYSYNAKIDTYYDLPPLLPCFQPVQPHTIYDHKPIYVDVKVSWIAWLPMNQKGTKKDMTRSYTLPCTIGSLNFYAMLDLGASINVISKSMFEFMKLTHHNKTDMLVEMADMTNKAPIRIVENVLVKIDKFLFPSDFVVIDMLDEHNKTMILGKSFLVTIHVEINIRNKELSLGVWEDGITFDMDKKIYDFTTSVE